MCFRLPADVVGALSVCLAFWIQNVENALVEGYSRAQIGKKLFVSKVAAWRAEVRSAALS